MSNKVAVNASMIDDRGNEPTSGPRLESDQVPLAACDFNSQKMENKDGDHGNIL